MSVESLYPSQLNTEGLLASEEVLYLIGNRAMSLDGISCAIPLRRAGNVVDPFFPFEDAIGNRLGCATDEDGFALSSIRLGVTYGRALKEYGKQARSEPEVLIVTVSTQPDEQEVEARLLMPFLKPGRTDGITVRGRYTTKDSKHGVTLTRADKAVSSHVKSHPFARASTGGTAILTDRRSGRTLVGKHGGSISTA